MSNEIITPDKEEKVSVPLAVIQGIVVLLLIGAGVYGYIWYINNKPKAKRKPVTELITVVKVQELKKADYPTTITGMGTVVPNAEIELAARVGGEVIYVSPELIPGGRFAKGQKILEIDPSDYKLAVEQSKSNIAKAQKELKMEMGQQSISKREIELLGDKVKKEDMELVLREPHLKMAKAELESAKAALKKAQLDLERTTITAPFNAAIESNTADFGSQVTMGASLAKLVGTDEFLIEVSVPVDRLAWLNLPEKGKKGSEVIITNKAAWSEGKSRVGHVVRLLPKLEDQGRMAKLLIEVQDPFCLQKENFGKPKLILNMYVHVEIKGKEMKNVFRITSNCLHDGNKIYLYEKAKDDSHRLVIKDVNIIWRHDGYVFVRNSIKTGQFIVTSDIPTPVQDMKLKEIKAPTKADANE